MLRCLRESLDELNQLALEEEPSYLDFLAYVVAQEVRARDETQLQKRIPAATFPSWRTLDIFDFKFQTGGTASANRPQRCDAVTGML